MKQRVLAAALALALAAMAGCGRPEAPAGPVRLAVASDIHYVGSGIEDGGEAFRREVEMGDGRQLDYIRPITDALIDQLLREKPDGLIVTGDLSLNGEKNSHQELAARLETLVEAGVPVYVLPGNHDINNYNAARFAADEVLPTERVSPEEFEEIYKNCGFSAADSRDRASLSYMVKLNAGVWLFMLDAQQYADQNEFLPYFVGGKLQDETYEWLEKLFRKCQKAGAVPLVAVHQNLALHNERFSSGYTLFENDRLGRLIADYGGEVCFSGHLHPQHIAAWTGPRGEQVWDVASGSLAVWPYLCGRLTVEPDGAGRAAYRYEAEPTDLTAWAAAQGLSDPAYRDFSAFGRAQFAQNSTSRGAQSFIETLGPADGEAFRRVMGEMNVLYFSGALTAGAAAGVQASPDWQAVERAAAAGLDTAGYLESLLAGAGESDMCHLTLPLEE